MNRTRSLWVGATFLTLLVALGISQAALDKVAIAQAQGALQAPRFEVDPFWPKPLPNHWLLGNAIGVWVDDQDNVWIVHRGSATLAATEKALELKAGECCAGAPPVLVFDKQGNLVRHWGGPGRATTGRRRTTASSSTTPECLDRRQRRRRLPDHEVHQGRQVRGAVRQAERARERQERARAADVHANSNDPTNFGRVAKIFVDPKANEAYIADGYFNRRVAVLDAATGKMKRFWGAYGKKPDDTVALGVYDPAAPPFQHFRNPVHCADLSNDGFVYVCDRVNDRIQVFRPDGTFVKEAFIAKNTKSSGSVWDVAFSQDPQQRFLYVVDGIEQPDLHPAARHDAAPDQLRRRRPAAGAVLRRAQYRRRLAGQHLHDRDLGREAAAEVRVQGTCPGHEAQSGHGLADALGPGTDPGSGIRDQGH